MRFDGWFLAIGAVGLLLPASGGAQQQRNERAPVIRLSSGVIESNYIEPSVLLDEDSYVFALTVDADGQLRVLHPEFPGLSVMMSARRELQLPRFFAAVGRDPLGDVGYGYASTSFGTDHSGVMDSRGTVIALASRRPFNLAAISSGGDWNYSILRRLVDGKGPHAAASALARELSAKGEPVGRDVLRFFGAPVYSAYNSYYGCHVRYGSLGFRGTMLGGYPAGLIQLARLREAGYVVAFAGVDACGEPQFVIYPNAFKAPNVRAPAKGAFPKSRLPAGLPRNPAAPPTVSARVATPAVPVGDRSVGARLPQRVRTEGRRAPRGNTAAPARGAFPVRRAAPPPSTPRTAGEKK